MKKLKKILIIVLFIITILSNICYGYSSEYYSITIPSSFVEISDNLFMNDVGSSILIEVSSQLDTSDFKYNEKNLNSFTNGLMEATKNTAQTRKKIEQTYGDIYTESQINEYLDTYKLHILKKEISTITEKKYKCFHILSQISFTLTVNNSPTTFYSYQEHYVIVSKDRYYILMITGDNESFINSSEIQSAINSFTIKNYQEIEENETILEKMLATAIVTLITGGIYAIFDKSKNTNETQVAQKYKTSYCNYCGNQLLDSDNFCISCGKKITK